MTYDLAGKTVLITGANRGIGKAILETFLHHGAAKIYAGVRKLENADSLVSAYGGKVVPICIDLADPASITAAAAVAQDVQVVINNAGVLHTTGPLDPGFLAALASEMEVNVHGLVRMAQAFAPVLQANGGGVFAQLNSVVSMKSFAAFSSYSASKAASYSITQSLREVLKPQGTLVLSVHPGPIATDMGREAGLEEIAEPASVVGEAIVTAMQKGEFHVFPDSMARQIGGAYDGFARGVVEADMAVG
jgi:NAD(P)-dependent dehydrogenase (short-subunit alcohol dehydrogenase family)